MGRGRNRSRIGAWRLLEKLGEGPLGEVHQSCDPRDDRVVAALGLAGRGAASRVIPVHHEPLVHRLEVHAAPQRAPRRLLSWQRVAAALAAVGLLVGLNVLLFGERPAPPAAEASAPGAPPPSHGSHR